MMPSKRRRRGCRCADAVQVARAVHAQPRDRERRRVRAEDHHVFVEVAARQVDQKKNRGDRAGPGDHWNGERKDRGILARLGFALLFFGAAAPLGRAKSMSIAISISRMPPAIVNAGRVMSEVAQQRGPTTPMNSITPAATAIAWSMIRARRARRSARCSPGDRNHPIGSMIVSAVAKAVAPKCQSMLLPLLRRQRMLRGGDSGRLRLTRRAE